VLKVLLLHDTPEIADAGVYSSLFLDERRGVEAETHT
jgi:hypothetical protein